MNMFEMAIRGKYRFPYKGLLLVEDLWDLKLEQLDEIYGVLNSQIKRSKEESLLYKNNAEDDVLDCKIEIIKYIVKTKIEETTERLLAKEKREKKQMLLAALSSKEQENLKNKSAEEIQKMIDEL